MPLADAARMRALELVLGTVSRDELMAPGDQSGVTQKFSDAEMAVRALQRALDSLRSFKCRRPTNPIGASHGETRTPIASGASQYTYTRNMAGLCSLETTVSGYEPVNVNDHERPLPASLLTLGLNVDLTDQPLPADAPSIFRSRTCADMTSAFAVSAQSLVRLELSISPPHIGASFDSDIIRAFLLQHVRLTHLTLRTIFPIALPPARVGPAPRLHTLRLYDVEPSVATVAALGCVGVRRLTIGRSVACAPSAWSDIVESAALPILEDVTIERLDAAREWDYADSAGVWIWPARQRDDLGEACQGRGVKLSAFWSDC